MSEGIEAMRAARVESLGQAFVIRGGEHVRYRVENLSTGGALLCDGPPLPRGERLHLLLRVDPLPPFEVEARVAWRGDGQTAGYGVEFLSLDAAGQDAIHEAVGAILAGEHADATRQPLHSWLP